MSQTFSLVCHEKRKRVWIGQGSNGLMSSFYSGDPAAMAALHRFILETAGLPIELFCNDWAPDEFWEYDDFESLVGGVTDGVLPLKPPPQEITIVRGRSG
jgi:hypothetical protein